MTCLARERTDPIEDQDLMAGGYPWPSTRRRIAEILAQNVEFPTVLDLRPGPWPCAGFPFLGDSVRLISLDPLASSDRGLGAQRASEVAVYSERLLERFDSDRFDLIFARDWVDRCRDPQGVIRQMLRVVKPAGFVLMEHRLGTAGQSADDDLQRWGLLVDGAGGLDSRFRESTARMSRELGAVCQVESERVDSGEHWLIIQIRKNR